MRGRRLVSLGSSQATVEPILGKVVQTLGLTDGLTSPVRCLQVIGNRAPADLLLRMTDCIKVCIQDLVARPVDDNHEETKTC